MTSFSDLLWCARTLIDSDPEVFPLVDEERTLALGRAFADVLTAPRLIFLKGDLGAGKTTFVRGVIQGLGNMESVVSPTYTLVEEYITPEFLVHHLDLYRLSDPQELEGLGFRDRVGGKNVLFIEWPERAIEYLPDPDHLIELRYSGAERTLSLYSSREDSPTLRFE